MNGSSNPAGSPNTNVGPLSPDPHSDNWSPITGYQNLGSRAGTPLGNAPTSPPPPPPGDGPYAAAAQPPPHSSSNPNPNPKPGPGGLNTPPTSSHTSASTASDGSAMNGMSRRGPPSNGNPSPPSSVGGGRSSNGTGLYPSSRSGSIDSRRAYMMEDALSEHYTVLKNYLSPELRDDRGSQRQNRARDKLQRLSAVQFQELSTDVYDELLRREDERQRGGQGAPGNNIPKYLLPKSNFHYKRNQARQKLSTLPTDRFRQLATDVYYELERRFPRFAGGDIDRSASPAMSVASSMARGPPPRTDSANGFRNGPGPRYPPRDSSNSAGRGPGRANRPYPPPSGYDSQDDNGSVRSGEGGASYGRALPKQFQSNTIVPNKSTMVEDDDDQSVMSGGAVDGVGGGGPDPEQQRIIDELRGQVQQLEGKVDQLEGEVRSRTSELEKTQAATRGKDNAIDEERTEFETLRYNLERKLDEAQRLNSSLESSVSRLRAENAESGRDLHAQLDEARAASSSRGRSNTAGSDEWKQRYERLERDYAEQQQITEDVRREAAQFLAEMRTLSAQSNQAYEKEEQLMQQVSALEREVQDWKSRFTKTKTQLRSLRASSMGLSNAMPTLDKALYNAGSGASTQEDGCIKDVHVTRFQLGIDELLQSARNENPNAILEAMKTIVNAVRNINSDVEASGPSLSTLASPSSVSADGSNSPQPISKLKSRLNNTANNLITASKNHASALGLSPVSLVDAAVSHLTTAVVEPVRAVKIRPTPANELEEEDDYVQVEKPLPLVPANGGAVGGLRKGSLPGLPGGPQMNGMTNGMNGANGVNGMNHQRDYSGSSDVYSESTSDGGRPFMNGFGGGNGGGFGGGPGPTRDRELDDFKNYLEDQTALLVRSIQPLVNTIRSASPGRSADDDDIEAYVSEVSQTVLDIADQTQGAINSTRNPALRELTGPVLDALEKFRGRLVNDERRRKPAAAFKIAKATKELVMRVERVENGEVGGSTDLPDDLRD